MLEINRNVLQLIRIRQDPFSNPFSNKYKRILYILY